MDTDENGTDDAGKMAILELLRYKYGQNRIDKVKIRKLPRSRREKERVPTVCYGQLRT